MGRRPSGQIGSASRDATPQFLTYSDTKTVMMGESNSVRGYGVCCLPSLLALLVIWSPGCDRQERRRFLNEGVGPRPKKLLLDASRTLRERFNAGTCQTIYAEAAHSFHSSPVQSWQIVCEEMRKDLGIWNEYRTNSFYYCSRSPDVICIDGLAQFSKGGHRLQIAWLLSTNKAELFFWDLQWGHVDARFPAETQKMIDPPTEHPGALGRGTKAGMERLRCSTSY